MCKGAVPGDTGADHSVPEASAVKWYIRDRLFQEEFEVQEGTLGSGISGDVKPAIGRDGVKYAVKRIDKVSLSAQELGRVEKEVHIHLAVCHPHIVRLDWVFESCHDVHLVMEHLRGGELYDHIAYKGNLSEVAAARTIRQIMLAVAYLHRHRVVHRDLKPENIMFADEACECVKIVDMGLATYWNGQTHLTEACGTPYYAAPEVWQQSYTDQAEMWALGVIAHEALLACSPFPGSDHAAIAMSREGRVIFGNGFHRLSEDAQDFLKCLLTAEPSGRLTAVAALNHPWLRAAEPVPKIARTVQESMSPDPLQLRDVTAGSRICANSGRLCALQEQVCWDSFRAFDVAQCKHITGTNLQPVKEVNDQGVIAKDARAIIGTFSEVDVLKQEMHDASSVLDMFLYFFRLFGGVTCICSGMSISLRMSA